MSDNSSKFVEGMTCKQVFYKLHGNVFQFPLLVGDCCVMVIVHPGRICLVLLDWMRKSWKAHRACNPSTAFADTVLHACVIPVPTKQRQQQFYKCNYLMAGAIIRLLFFHSV